MATVQRTPADVVRAGADYLARHDVPHPRQTAETLLMRLLSTDRAGLYSRKEGLDQATARLFARSLCARCRGTPVQHLTGEQQFRQLRLRVTPEVLIPRPETEVLVDVVTALVPGSGRPLVVDVGTGTGAVALAVKFERPGARVIGTDLSGAAVQLARENAKALDLDIEVRQGDLLDALPQDVRGAIDVLVSNPPYLTEEEYESLPVEVRSEPREALVGGTDVHRLLVAQARGWLRPDGWLVVEIGADQGPEVAAMFKADGFDAVEILPDLAGRQRIVRGRVGRQPA